MARANADLCGLTFGRLYVQSRASRRGERHTRYLCICKCGRKVEVPGDRLVSGVTKSCGCYRVEAPQYNFRKHPKEDERLYNVWCNMKARCTNPNVKEYRFYGGRGITVCSEWQNDFSTFSSWAKATGYDALAPKGICTLDRIDTNKNYTPDNCRWISQEEQARNTRACRFITYNGETMTLNQWSARLGMAPGAVSKRLRRGWTETEAVTIPANTSRFSN